MTDKITFGATFQIKPSTAEDAKLFIQEGLTSEKVRELSRALNKDTPRNYKLLLVERNRYMNTDTFVLRHKASDGNWQTVSSFTTKLSSANGFRVRKLENIFDILNLQAKHTKQENKLLDKLARMQQEYIEKSSILINQLD